MRLRYALPVGISLTGVLLLQVVFYFNVNPVAACAVDSTLKAHPAFLMLLVTTTVPAMYAGLVAASWTALGSPYFEHAYYALSYVAQAILYGGLGLGVSWLCRRLSIWRKRHDGSSRTPENSA